MWFSCARRRRLLPPASSLSLPPLRQLSTPSIGYPPLHLHPVTATAWEPYDEHPRCSSYGTRARIVSVLHVLPPPASTCPAASSPLVPVPLNTRETQNEHLRCSFCVSRACAISIGPPAWDAQNGHPTRSFCASRARMNITTCKKKLHTRKISNGPKSCSTKNNTAHLWVRCIVITK
jgi:hypothetical protein